MRHWEERGVKVRVELGSAEVAAGTAVVAAAAAKAGDLATKTTHKVKHHRLRALLKLCTVAECGVCSAV